MPSYVRTILLSKIFHSLIIFTSFLGGLMIFNHSPFTSIDFLLIYTFPILVYAFLKRTSSLKKQFISNITLSFWIALPGSLGLGWFIGTPDNHDAMIIKTFDWSIFFTVSLTFLVLFFTITFIALFIGFYLKALLLPKLPKVIIE